MINFTTLLTIILRILLTSAYIDAGWSAVRVQIKFVANCYHNRSGILYNVTLWEHDKGKGGILGIDRDDQLQTVQCYTGEPCVLHGIEDEENPHFYLQFDAISCYTKDHPVVQVCVDFPMESNGNLAPQILNDQIVLLSGVESGQHRIAHNCSKYD